MGIIKGICVFILIFMLLGWGILYLATHEESRDVEPDKVKWGHRFWRYMIVALCFFGALSVLLMAFLGDTERHIINKLKEDNTTTATNTETTTEPVTIEINGQIYQLIE